MLAAAFGAGLLAGIVHALTGPDHLAAIAPLSLERRSGAWRIGLSWGLGHSGGVWVLSVLALGLRGAVPTAVLSHWGERLVGAVLVAIGVWSCRRALRSRIALPLSAPGDSFSFRAEADRAGRTHRHPAPLGIGLLHGVAGSHHFLAALPVLALPNGAAAAGYIGGFGLGAILGMAFFSWVLGKWVSRPITPGSRGFRAARLATGGFAIGIGVFWLWTGGM